MAPPKSRRCGGLLCAAALAAASRLSLPSAFVAGVAERTLPGHRAGSLRPLAARGGGWLDDIGKGMQDTAVSAATGLSQEESEELMDRSKSGKMNYDDFLKMLTALSKMANTAGFLEKFTGGQGTEGLEVRIDEYKRIMKQMDPDVRADPSLLRGEGQDVKKRIEKLAKACDSSVKEIDTFLMEAQTMSSMFGKLGANKDMNTVRREMAEERAEAEARDKSRLKRREVKRLKAKNRDTKPEWMTI